MKNSARLKEIVCLLEKNHINLYHDISKQQVEEHIASIKDIDKLSDLEFDYEMLKFFALFKESHTIYRVPYQQLDKSIFYQNGNFYLLTNDNKYKKIEKFGDFTTEKVASLIEEIACFETREWLAHQTNNLINNGYILKMLKILNTDSVEIEVDGGEKLELSLAENKFANQSRKKPYEYKISDGILYLRYRQCVNDQKMPFIEVVEQIKQHFLQGEIKQYILDIRNNGGGNSEVLNPFQEMVKESKIKGVILIDEGVASSGIFAVARFKKDFDTTLIGMPTGGTAKHYGYMKPLEVDGKQFTASIRLFDFSDIFGYTGAIQPDIRVPITIDDIENKQNPQLQAAYEFLLK